ncbi:MAG: excinuclease ABC subunit UvrB [candidate division WS1 bacterium]|jgi:excinuclease ABC subunit B|nr:excinuclease ABC subunit UvrB [candidate division WS1 bacterium]
MNRFEVVAEFEPTGDQPQAIEALAEGVRAGYPDQVLRGITGSGKTYAIAKVVEQVQKPTLVIAHNKTLAAQLCAEFREFFPHNAVEFFVSYYDYYQPEAYLPTTDTYIEKDSQINDEIERLRHSATQSIMERRDVLVVASVSCIFGLGSPEQYEEVTLRLHAGQRIERDAILEQLIKMQFARNDVELKRGSFRVRGDVVEITPMDNDEVIRVEMWGDEVERMMVVDPLTGEIIDQKGTAVIFPATHFVASRERAENALEAIQRELYERVAYFHRENMLLEAQRLEQRTMYDLEMIREVGYCTGIENYSRHFDGRDPGETPFTLMDYFPDDKLLVIDESHQTIPQIQAMYHGDRSRKMSLVGHGFRLPCALDNRPLTFREWEERRSQVIYTSATPAEYELSRARQIVELVIRPTGLIDPEVEVRPTKGQVDDLIGEIRKRVERNERVLVTTLTKRMAEDLSDYLAELDFRVHYLHSDIDTIERTEILRDLRLGTFDVLVGINLLREGLDLPEVSLVAILDADREGFLRSETSLIQTMGRAARNVEGRVIMYADRVTDSMRRAMEESDRRRTKQIAYNEEHGITPQTIRKKVHDAIRFHQEVAEEAERTVPLGLEGELAAADLDALIQAMEEEMRSAAAELEFERAAELRDELEELREKASRKQP